LGTTFKTVWKFGPFDFEFVWILEFVFWFLLPTSDIRQLLSFFSLLLGRSMGKVGHWRTVRVRTDSFHPRPHYSYLSITVVAWSKNRGQTTLSTPPGKRLAQGMVGPFFWLFCTRAKEAARAGFHAPRLGTLIPANQRLLVFRC
jgi:hypothetical protein